MVVCIYVVVKVGVILIVILLLLCVLEIIVIFEDVEFKFLVYDNYFVDVVYFVVKFFLKLLIFYFIEECFNLIIVILY